MHRLSLSKDPFAYVISENVTYYIKLWFYKWWLFSYLKEPKVS